MNSLVVDKKVITNLMNEDAATQKSFYRQYFGYLMSICLRYMHDKDDALEVCQDVFLKVFQKIAKYDSSRDFKKWLSSITINACIDALRKRKKRLSEDSLEEDIHENIAFINLDVNEKMDAEAILKLINKINPKHKTVFLLYAVDGYSHKEISEMLEINPSTSRWHLAEARKELQPLITKHYLNDTATGKYYKG